MTRVNGSTPRDRAERALQRVIAEGDHESSVNEPIGRSGAWVEFECECGGMNRLESTRNADGSWSEPKLVHA